MESLKLNWKQADEEKQSVMARLGLSLETKDSQYSDRQFDHKQLDFKHKELKNHAEKLQKKVCMMASQELNR